MHAYIYDSLFWNSLFFDYSTFWFSSFYLMNPDKFYALSMNK